MSCLHRSSPDRLRPGVFANSRLTWAWIHSQYCSNVGSETRCTHHEHRFSCNASASGRRVSARTRRKGTGGWGREAGAGQDFPEAPGRVGGPCGGGAEQISVQRGIARRIRTRTGRQKEPPPSSNSAHELQVCFSERGGRVRKDIWATSISGNCTSCDFLLITAAATVIRE